MFIGAVSIDMSFWKWLKPLLTQQQIVYLEPVGDLILTKEDFGYQWLEEANLKIEFQAFDSLDREFLAKKLSRPKDKSTYKIFGDLLEYEKLSSQQATPTKSSARESHTIRSQPRHVKFLDFKANTKKKPERKLQDSILLPSKHSIITNSPDDEVSVTNISMRMTPPSTEEIEIYEHDETLAEEKRQLKLRSPPQTRPSTRKLEHEKEVKQNLSELTRDFSQSVQDYKNDTQEILKKLANLSMKQDRLEKDWERFQVTFIGLDGLRKITPEARRLYDEIHYEHELDIRDFKEANSYKQRELEKLEKGLSQARKENQKLRAQLSLSLPDDSKALYEKLEKLKKDGRKDLQPLLGENEMLLLKLEGLQEKRREIIDDLLSSSHFPTEEYSELINELNEETEVNFYLQKGASEQKITIEALTNVLRSQADTLSRIEKVYKEYTSTLERTIDDIKCEIGASLN